VSERAGSLGDLQAVPMRPGLLERPCARCGLPFVPLRVGRRKYCYRLECETRRERENAELRAAKRKAK